MRSPLKQFLLAAAVLLTGATVLSAQPDRLHRVLDPLGLLPPPQRVLRDLDRAVHSLPPVVIATRGPWDCGYDTHGGYCRIPAHRHYRVYRHERYEHHRHHPGPSHRRHDRHRHGW